MHIQTYGDDRKQIAVQVKSPIVLSVKYTRYLNETHERSLKQG